MFLKYFVWFLRFRATTAAACCRSYGSFRGQDRGNSILLLLYVFHFAVVLRIILQFLVNELINPTKLIYISYICMMYLFLFWLRSTSRYSVI